MNCPICKNKNTKLVYNQYSGYIENLKYDIYHYDQCDTNFASPNKINVKLYDLTFRKPGSLCKLPTQWWHDNCCLPTEFRKIGGKSEYARRSMEEISGNECLFKFAFFLGFVLL